MSPMLLTIHRLECRRAWRDAALSFLQQVAVCGGMLAVLAVANHYWS